MKTVLVATTIILSLFVESVSLAATRDVYQCGPLTLEVAEQDRTMLFNSQDDELAVWTEKASVPAFEVNGNKYLVWKNAAHRCVQVRVASAQQLE